VFGNRNNLILIGVALVAFLVFVVFSGGDGSSVGHGGGLWSRFLSGLTGGSAGSSGVAPPPPVGELGTASTSGMKKPPGEAGSPAPGTLRGKGAKKSTPKSGRAPDPNLVRRLGGSKDLVPATPPQSPREGIVRQRFTVSAGSQTQSMGGSDSASPNPESNSSNESPNPSDLNNCGSPVLNKAVIDVKLHPELLSAFTVPYNSPFIRLGKGERFQIGDAPAYVIYINGTKSGTAGAFFDNQFVVSIMGRCIPNRQFLKAQLRR
jgi:hypothetical protein